LSLSLACIPFLPGSWRTACGPARHRSCRVRAWSGLNQRCRTPPDAPGGADSASSCGARTWLRVAMQLAQSVVTGIGNVFPRSETLQVREYDTPGTENLLCRL